MTSFESALRRFASSLGNGGAIANCRRSLQEEQARDVAVRSLCRRLEADTAMDATTEPVASAG